MTAWGSIELAVEAMRRGAQDFVLKPWDNFKLVQTVRSQLQAPREARQQALRELSLARQVQQEMLPQKAPALRTLQLDAFCRQAGAVGGDSYDFYALGEGRCGLALADISGKGLASAMLMAHLVSALRMLMTQGSLSLEQRMQELNRQFKEATGPERFATLFAAEYDDATRTLRYVNCGHVPPVVMRAGGEVQRLDTTCPVVGLLPVYRAEAAEVKLAPGDLFAVYSDGIPDAPTWQGEFGDEGLIDLLRRKPLAGAQELTEEIAAGALAPQFDDMTLVLARAM
jgi:sigma-B regulation protein RsbU (phosphoserine phosphatase)